MFSQHPPTAGAATQDKSLNVVHMARRGGLFESEVIQVINLIIKELLIDEALLLRFFLLEWLILIGHRFSKLLQSLLYFLWISFQDILGRLWRLLVGYYDLIVNHLDVAVDGREVLNTIVKWKVVFSHLDFWFGEDLFDLRNFIVIFKIFLNLLVTFFISLFLNFNWPWRKIIIIL